MKTSNSGIRLSQTEALLNAIQAGFFEAYLEKKVVSKLLNERSCQSIRLNVVSTVKGKGFLLAKSVTQKGSESLLASREVVCNHTLLANQNRYTVDFNSADLRLLLAQPNCSGIRFFPGTISDSEPTLIAVGVKYSGFDIDDGWGYICGQSVPQKILA